MGQGRDISKSSPKSPEKNSLRSRLSETILPESPSSYSDEERNLFRDISPSYDNSRSGGLTKSPGKVQTEITAAAESPTANADLIHGVYSRHFNELIPGSPTGSSCEIQIDGASDIPTTRKRGKEEFFYLNDPKRRKLEDPRSDYPIDLDLPFLDSPTLGDSPNTYPSSPEAEVQKIHVLVEKQAKNQKEIHTHLEILQETSKKVNDLESWDVKKHLEYLVNNWENKYKSATLQETDRRSIDTDRRNVFSRINIQKREMVELEKHLKVLGQTKENIHTETEKVSSLSVPTGVDDVSLRSESDTTAASSVKDSLLFDVNDRGKTWQQIGEKIEKLIQETEAALNVTKGKHDGLISQYMQDYYPFFAKRDMSPTDTNIDFIPQGELPASSPAIVVKTLLKAQGHDVPVDRIAEKLELHPISGRVDLKKLQGTTLSELEDEEELQLQPLQSRGDKLVSALRKGPVGVVLNNDHRAATDLFRTWRAVTLDRIKPSDDHTYVRVLDPSSTAPYKVPITEFLPAWWNGLAFLPRATYNALQEMQ